MMMMMIDLLTRTYEYVCILWNNVTGHNDKISIVGSDCNHDSQHPLDIARPSLLGDPPVTCIETSKNTVVNIVQHEI
jgi:hypothetical protein